VLRSSIFTPVSFDEAHQPSRDQTGAVFCP